MFSKGGKFSSVPELRSASNRNGKISSKLTQSPQCAPAEVLCLLLPRAINELPLVRRLSGVAKVGDTRCGTRNLMTFFCCFTLNAVIFGSSYPGHKNLMTFFCSFAVIAAIITHFRHKKFPFAFGVTPSDGVTRCGPHPPRHSPSEAIALRRLKIWQVEIIHHVQVIFFMWLAFKCKLYFEQFLS